MLRRNLLIFHNAALGDFVVTWPLAMACGRLFPQSRIICVTAQQKGKLTEHVLGVESVDIESGWGALWSDAAALAPAARKMLDASAAIYSFVADESSAWTSNVRAIAPEAALAHLSTRPGSREPVARSIAHQLAATQPAVAAGVGQIIDSLSRRGFSSRPTTRGGVLIHPGSGAERKNWPRDRFIKLAQRIAATGHEVRIVLGEVEIEKWGAAARDEFAAVARIVQPQTLIELARATAESAVVVCNDSGPAHLSGIIGVPTICLFGPGSDPVCWRPLGPAVKVIVGETLDAISVDEIQSEVASALASPQSAPAQSAATSSEDE